MRFSKEHEWIRMDKDVATMGITAYAAQALGDIVFVDLPEIGRTVSAGEAIAVVESVKAASDVYAPIDGEVLEINTALGGSPDLVNSDPTGEAWFVKIRVKDVSQAEGLLDQDAYDAYLSTL